MTAWTLPMKRSEMIQTSKRAFGLLNGKTPHRRNALPFYIVTAYWQWAACGHRRDDAFQRVARPMPRSLPR